MRFPLVIAVVASTTVVLALGLATHLDPVPLGLHEQRAGDITRLTGAVCPLRAGTYLFAAAPPATIVLDGEVLTGPLHLAAGAHAVLIEYRTADHAAATTLLWARNGEALAPVPTWALRTRKIRSLPRLIVRDALDRALALAEWVWVGLLVLAAASLARAGLVAAGSSIGRTCDWPTLRRILAASLLLNVAGIGWGLPASWVAIELKPAYVLGALERHFSGGWYDAYPPVHFYLLSAAFSPMLLLKYLGRTTFDTAAAYSTLVLLSRLVSLVMAAGIVAAAAVCGTRAFGRRAGLFAAAIVAVTAPFLYYAKTANVDVPYLFWWAVSMVFYLRLRDTGATRDYLLFAAAATVSVCTKDQAYGLYGLAPLVLVEHLWRAKRRDGRPRAFLRALIDRRLVAAAIVAAMLFVICDNVVFNWRGFLDHVRFITGPGSAAYRVYEPTAAGRFALLRLTIDLIRRSMGVPLFAAGLAGFVLATTTAAHRRIAVWLVAPAVAYYLGFINVVLYNYDRFVLPMCFILAIFGGLAIDRLLSAAAGVDASRRRRPALAAAAVALAFAYTLLYAVTVDVLMIEDSRYEAERWMAAHVPSTDLVGFSGLHEYLPRLDTYPTEDISSPEELRQEHPDYVVLNADYARAVPPSTPWGMMIAGLEHEAIGYRRVRTFRHAAPWPWLPGGHPDLVGPRQETMVFSTLRNINPTIEIFERER